MENKVIEKGLYFIAVKIFLITNDNKLLIIKDKFGDWDLPGGRLRENDFNEDLEDVVKRKMEEEVGPSVTYKLGEVSVFMRHERDEILTSGDREKRRIFAIGYEVKYETGDIVLGSNHEKYEWVELNNFKPENYFTGGWLKGVQNYLTNYRK